MVNARELKKYIGNTCLYLQLDRARQRSFLERNLQQALEEHKQALAASMNAAKPANGMEPQMSDNQAWSFPTEEIHAALMKKQSPVLRIEIKGLKQKANGGRTEASSADLPRKRLKELEIPCQLEVVIWAGKIDPENQVHRDVQTAVLKVSRNEYQERIFDIDMKAPFLFEESKLVSLVERGDRWKRTLDTPCIIMIAINFMDMDDASTLSPFLDPDGWAAESRSYRKLTAKWTKLPECPEPGIGLDLYGAAAGSKKRLSYDLNVDMGWSASRETPLQTYNRALRKSQTNTDRDHQLPSPVSEAKSLREEYMVTYAFKDGFTTKTLTLLGCKCVMCNQKEYHSSEQLHFHLNTYHDLFKFAIKKKESESEAGLLIEISVEVDLSDRYDDGRARSSVPNIHTIDWVAPSRPFNVKKYLVGKEEWATVSAPTERKRAHHAPKATQVLVIKAKSPSEVEDIPTRQRKKYRVPRPPSKGVIFFRKTSKRPLEEGEYLSESDDSVEDEWLKLRRVRDIKKTAIPSPAQVFLEVFDDYIQEELLSGDFLLGDALVRFTRSKRDWLFQPDMAQEFLQKVTELYEDRIISTSVWEYCKQVAQELQDSSSNTQGSVQITARPGSLQKSNGILEERPQGTLNQMPEKINPTSTSKSPEPEVLENEGIRSPKVTRKRDDDGDVIMEDGTLIHNPRQVIGIKNAETSMHNRCYCGRHAEGFRTVIWCANHDCIRHSFHLSCVNLARRIPDWHCRDCR